MRVNDKLAFVVESWKKMIEMPGGAPLRRRTTGRTTGPKPTIPVRRVPRGAAASPVVTVPQAARAAGAPQLGFGRRYRAWWAPRRERTSR